MPKRPAFQPLISDQRLMQLYVTLLQCRMLRQQSRMRRRPAPLVAPEGIVTGTVTHLEEQDALTPLPGEPLGALARGHSLRRLLAGRTTPGMLPAVSTAAARFAIATGYALANREQKQVTMAMSGPGVASLDGLRESMALAAAQKLPILFVIETNAETDVSGPRHTDALGLPGIPVDGDDVVAIYRATQESITRARRGGGPTIIDCKPWPLGKPLDPVHKLEQALERRGLLTPAKKASTLTRVQKQFQAAAQRSPRPSITA